MFQQREKGKLVTRSDLKLDPSGSDAWIRLRRLEISSAYKNFNNEADRPIKLRY